MKSLKEVFGFAEADNKKLNAGEIRNLIKEELKIILEQEESAEQDETVDVGEPKGTVFTGQTSFKGVDANEVAAQILTRDPEQPIFKAMAFEDDDGETVEADPDAVADWLEDTGLATFMSRVDAVGSKIPKSGLAKNQMPFLPGPSDAQGSIADVEDALTPGGKFNIDVSEPYSTSSPINFEEEVKEEAAYKRGMHYLVEQEAPAPNSFIGPDAPGAEQFMTAGLNDGDEEDDSIEIQIGGSVVASDATPTQTNILLPKALGMAVNGVEGGNLKAYVSTDDEILDGHHRWAATMLNNPSASFKTIAKIDLKKHGSDKTLQYLTAIGNALGNKTKNESYRRKSDSQVVLERWRRLAGVI